MPVRSGAARRYADALFSLAVERGTIDTWGAELTRLADAVKAPGAERALMTPSVSLREKQAALQTAAGPLSREVMFVVNLLLARRRIELLPALAEAFADRVRKHRGIELAEVTTAIPLTDPDRQLIAQRLERTLGRRVEMTTRVDPAIMGGVVVRVGDQLFDASVRGKLERMRRRLAAGLYRDDGPQPAAARSPVA